VDALTRPHARRLDDDSGYALLAKAAIAALQELDAGGLFGKGAERNRLLLIIVTEDTPKDWSTESARKCNPAAVFARFEADTKVEGVYSASDTIAIAPDGNSLYSAGSRDKPDAAKDDDCSEMVAYDLRDARLTRRWTVEDPGLGRSICRLAVAPDGHSVVAAGAKYADKISHCELWRFAANSGKVTHQRQFVGDFADLGQSAEGQRLAVTCHNKTLHLFDADFKPLARRAFEQKVRSPLFLRSGQLLLATDKGILSLDPAGDVEPTIVTPLRAFHLVADGGQTLLAVAQRTHRPSASEISYGRAPGTEFGVHLLRLPDFNPIRTILLPNHQVNRPTLSPDGRLLAFEAQEIGKPRSFLAIFDTITGAEIARREIDAMHQLAFLPDNQTLAIAVSKISTTEPIDFWRIPK
jgi:hypothetical protein